MALLCVLLRETVGRLVGADDHARLLLDVFDRCRSPDVGRLLSPGITVGSVARQEGDVRRGAPAAVIQKQHAPIIQEHGVMPGPKGHPTSIGKPLGEIDEGHQARNCTHMVIFYLIQGRAGRSRAFELLPPRVLGAYSPACLTWIGPKRASRAANKASNGKTTIYEEGGWRGRLGGGAAAWTYGSRRTLRSAWVLWLLKQAERPIALCLPLGDNKVCG